MSYLKTIYFRDETGENDYPQKLCNHISDEILSKYGDLKGKKLLDIGSGKGNHLIGFKRRGLEIFGIDKRVECQDAVEGIEVRECDIESEAFPYEDNFFDFAYTKSVIEHVTNTDNFVKETMRVLKPGGVAIFMTPDWKSQHKCYWDDYTHVKAWTRKGLQDALHIHGFKNVKCNYFLQLPFVWKTWWGRYVAFLFSLLPDALKWRDFEEKDFRTIVRFSKEKMLLAIGQK